MKPRGHAMAFLNSPSESPVIEPAPAPISTARPSKPNAPLNRVGNNNAASVNVGALMSSPTTHLVDEHDGRKPGANSSRHGGGSGSSNSKGGKPSPTANSRTPPTRASRGGAAKSSKNTVTPGTVGGIKTENTTLFVGDDGDPRANVHARNELKATLKATDLSDLRERELNDWLEAAIEWTSDRSAVDTQTELIIVSVLNSMPWHRFTDETVAQSGSKHGRMHSAFERLCCALLSSGTSGAPMLLPLCEVIFRPFVQAAQRPAERVHIPADMIVRILSVAAGRHPQAMQNAIHQCVASMAPKDNVEADDIHAQYVGVVLSAALEEQFPSLPTDDSEVCSACDGGGGSGGGAGGVGALQTATPPAFVKNNMLRFSMDLLRIALHKSLAMEMAYNAATRAARPSKTIEAHRERIRSAVGAVHHHLLRDLQRAEGAGCATQTLPWLKEVLQFHVEKVVMLPQPVALHFLVPSIVRSISTSTMELTELVHKCLSVVVKGRPEGRHGAAGASAAAAVGGVVGGGRSGNLTLRNPSAAVSTRPYTTSERTVAAQHIFPLFSFLQQSMPSELREATMRRVLKWAAHEALNVLPVMASPVTATPSLSFEQVMGTMNQGASGCYLGARGAHQRLIETVVAQGLAVLKRLGLDASDSARELPRELLAPLVARIASADGRPWRSRDDDDSTVDDALLDRLLQLARDEGMLLEGLYDACPWASGGAPGTAKALFSSSGSGADGRLSGTTTPSGVPSTTAAAALWAQTHTNVAGLDDCKSVGDELATKRARKEGAPSSSSSSSSSSASSSSTSTSSSDASAVRDEEASPRFKAGRHVNTDSDNATESDSDSTASSSSSASSSSRSWSSSSSSSHGSSGSNFLPPYQLPRSVHDSGASRLLNSDGGGTDFDSSDSDSASSSCASDNTDMTI